MDSGKQAAKDLPAAEDFLNMLIEYTEDTLQPSLSEDNVFEDRFEITAIEPGKLHLSAFNSAEDNFVVKIPQSISSSCKEGWCISGAVGKKDKTSVFLDVWNVYP